MNPSGSATFHHQSAHTPAAITAAFPTTPIRPHAFSSSTTAPDACTARHAASTPITATSSVTSTPPPPPPPPPPAIPRTHSHALLASGAKNTAMSTAPTAIVAAHAAPTYHHALGAFRPFLRRINTTVFTTAVSTPTNNPHARNFQLAPCHTPNNPKATSEFLHTCPTPTRRADVIGDTT